MLNTVLFSYVLNMTYCTCITLHLQFFIFPFVFKRVLESHFQSQKENYEKEIEGLNLKVEHLSQDINHLQKLFREENDINDGIRLEVSRLTSENLVRSRCSQVKIVSVGSTIQNCQWHKALKNSASCLDFTRLKLMWPSEVAHPHQLFPM